MARTLFAVFVLLSFISWSAIAFRAMSDLDETRRKPRRSAMDPARVVAYVLLVAALLLTIVGKEVRGLSWTAFFDAFYANLATTFVGIALTVLVIDRLVEWRDTRRDKERILLQLASPSNAFALEAVRLARANGWLKDGTLQDARLVGADLSTAHLANADLRNADMLRAKLRETNLYQADLSGANLRRADFRGANLGHASLRGAYLRKTVFVGANLTAADLTDATFDATYYSSTTIWPEGFVPCATMVLVADDEVIHPG